MKKIPVIIRVILTLALVFAVYVETGIWTAISIGLIFAGVEINTILIKTVRAEWRKLVTPSAKDLEFIKGGKS